MYFRCVLAASVLVILCRVAYYVVEFVVFMDIFSTIRLQCQLTLLLDTRSRVVLKLNFSWKLFQQRLTEERQHHAQVHTPCTLAAWSLSSVVCYWRTATCESRLVMHFTTSKSNIPTHRWNSDTFPALSRFKTHHMSASVVLKRVVLLLMSNRILLKSATTRIEVNLPLE